MPYIYRQEIRFRHCDPAGIVFYPRFFEMTNDAVESFFAEVLELPFGRMHADAGVPTAQIRAEFHAPSRLGDSLEIALQVTRVGRSSLDFSYDAHCGAERRFSAASTVVFVNDRGRPQPWDDRVRAILTKQMEGVSDGT
jgi:4-hydroxybenzoyl-CoA thioesterase